MGLKASTGLRNAVLSDNPLRTVMAGGRINIYAGTEPATADDAVGGATLLCVISNNSTGTGINFDTAAVAGILSKAPAEVWSGINAATGTATWYRHVAVGDTGASSTTQPRIQGSINAAGGDMVLSNPALTSGATQTLDYYSVAWPTL